MFTTIACLALWGMMAQQPTTEPLLKPMIPVLTLTGDQSRIPGPRYVLCLSQKHFDDTWQSHTIEPAKVYYSSRPAPIIDFKHYMVVMVFEGSSMNSQGYKIDAVDEFKQSIRVRFTPLNFSTVGPDGGGVVVQPWLMAVLPRSDKKVVFEKNHPKSKGAPANYERVETVTAQAPDSYVRKMH